MRSSDTLTGKKLFFIAALGCTAGILLSDSLSSAASAVLIPLGIAYASARIVRPLGVFLSHKAHISSKAGCAVWGALICFSAGLVLTNLSSTAWDKLTEAAEYIPRAAETAADMLESVSGKVRSMLPEVLSSSDSSSFGEVISQAFRQAAAQLGSSAADMLKKAVAVFPNGIFSLFIGTVSFLYLTADMDGIGKSITSLMTGFLGEERSHAISRTFSGFTDAVFTYLRSYLLLTLITFSELSAGFLVIGLERPFSAAFAAAIIDALPLLGCGIVLIPWAVWCFIDGNISRGVILIVLQIIIYAVRQFAEPRIIGKMTGVHPFIVLAVLFAGLKIGGVAGMILAPILLIAAVSMKKADNRKVPDRNRAL